MKIPEDRIPYKVTVNGVTTVLESGAELTVSASVQDAIEATEDFPADPLPVDKPWECGYPAPKSGDTGKVLTVGEDGKPGWYEASSGATVVANPTLAGTEADLTGLQVGDTKYKVPEGGGALLVTVTETPGPGDGETTYTANKTAGEIINAMPLVFYKDEDNGATAFSRCSSYYYAEGEGYTFMKLDGDHDLFAATINDYPSRTVGDK